MIENSKIKKYEKVIKALYIASLVMSILSIISQGIDIAISGEWFILTGINVDDKVGIIISYICGLLFVHIGAITVSVGSILYKIDCARVYQCVNKKDKLSLTNVLSVGDFLHIFYCEILDILWALFTAMFAGFGFGGGIFPILFARMWGSFIGAHICGYVASIFYFLCWRVKKKELSKDLHSYLADKKKELLEKQQIEKIANDKITTQQLLEKCGMKFFLKYYKLLIRLPVRDIEVDENYTTEEKNERLTAAKAIITRGFSKYAAQHILDNYSDLLTDDEKAIANEILSTK